MKTLKSRKGDIPLPCLDAILVPAAKVVANNYNPNHVAENNMVLLERSILDNGFCFPIVTIYDAEVDQYIIIDGFHRFDILRNRLDVEQIPVVVLQHNIKQRMAATIQFNRARGIHQVELMGDLVQALVEQGMHDEDIAKQLGMEGEEVYRLKQVTGIAELFKNQFYSRSWVMAEVDGGV